MKTQQILDKVHQNPDSYVSLLFWDRLGYAGLRNHYFDIGMWWDKNQKTYTFQGTSYHYGELCKGGIVVTEEMVEGMKLFSQSEDGPFLEFIRQVDHDITLRKSKANY